MALDVQRTGGRKADIETTRVAHEGVVELHLAVHPPAGEGGFQAQASGAYQGLFEALGQEGMTPADLVCEKLFFTRIESQFDALEALRAEAYRQHGLTAEGRPAATFLQQPPCEPGRLFELQALAVRGSEGCPVERRPVPGLPGLASGKVLEYGGRRHVYLNNLTGAGEDDVPFTDRVQRVFDRSQACLKRAGLAFDDVVRTWIYIVDIERDYDAFNPVRTAFYDGCKISRIPASTGIQGGTYPVHAACALDLYALGSGGDARIEVMHAPTMNEATAYGSTFSRGMKVQVPGKTTAYVSGTASIDTAGHVMHEGDPAAQIHRMLDNVEALLSVSHAGFDDFVSAITYLKASESLDLFHAIWAERGLPQDIPNTITVADVCRPEWLCEIEGIAVFPETQS